MIGLLESYAPEWELEGLSAGGSVTHGHLDGYAKAWVVTIPGVADDGTVDRDLVRWFAPHHLDTRGPGCLPGHHRWCCPRPRHSTAHAATLWAHQSKYTQVT